MRNNNQLIIGKKHKLYYQKNESEIYPYIAIIKDEEGNTVKKVGLTEKSNTPDLRKILIEYEENNL